MKILEKENSLYIIDKYTDDLIGDFIKCNNIYVEYDYVLEGAYTLTHNPSGYFCTVVVEGILYFCNLHFMVFKKQFDLIKVSQKHIVNVSNIPFSKNIIDLIFDRTSVDETQIINNHNFVTGSYDDTVNYVLDYLTKIERWDLCIYIRDNYQEK